jgi:hypothetical protein
MPEGSDCVPAALPDESIGGVSVRWLGGDAPRSRAAWSMQLIRSRAFSFA